MTTILRTIVGSHAHGLNTPESDTDIKEVFVVPTEHLFRVDAPAEKARKVGEDDVGYELGHLLKLALACNPTILEVLATRSEFATEEGARLQSLFPSFLSKGRIRDAFMGYASSQRHRMDEATVLLTNGAVASEKRRRKALAARLRILYGGWELLEHGTLTVRIADVPVIGEQVRRAKFGEMSNEEGAEIAVDLMVRVDAAYETSTLPETADVEAVNRFLVAVRRNHLTHA